MMDGIRIVAVFDNFTAKEFIDAVELMVNSFSFDVKGTVQTLMAMSEEKQSLLRQAIDSCVYALAKTDRIDGRNELSAEACRKLNSVEDPLPEVGARFLRVHPTLQQSAMKLFCCYLDKERASEYQDAMEALRKEKGPEWYRFPLI